MSYSSWNSVRHRDKQSLTKPTEYVSKRKSNQNSNPAYRYGGSRKKQSRSELPKEESFVLQGLQGLKKQRADRELV